MRNHKFVTVYVWPISAGKVNNCNSLYENPNSGVKYQSILESGTCMCGFEKLYAITQFIYILTDIFYIYKEYTKIRLYNIHFLYIDRVSLYVCVGNLTVTI